MRCAVTLVKSKETKINPMRSTRRKYIPIQWKWFAQTPFRRGPCQKTEIQVTLVKPIFFGRSNFGICEWTAFSFQYEWTISSFLTWFGSCFQDVDWRLDWLGGYRLLAVFTPRTSVSINFYFFVFPFARLSISVSLSRLFSISHVPPRK